MKVQVNLELLGKFWRAILKELPILLGVYVILLMITIRAQPVSYPVMNTIGFALGCLMWGTLVPKRLRYQVGPIWGGLALALAGTNVVAFNNPDLGMKTDWWDMLVIATLFLGGLLAFHLETRSPDQPPQDVANESPVTNSAE